MLVQLLRWGDSQSGTVHRKARTVKVTSLSPGSLSGLDHSYAVHRALHSRATCYSMITDFSLIHLTMNPRSLIGSIACSVPKGSTSLSTRRAQDAKQRSFQRQDTQTLFEARNKKDRAQTPGMLGGRMQDHNDDEHRGLRLQRYVLPRARQLR